jgi:putative ABC transport system permease protein
MGTYLRVLAARIVALFSRRRGHGELNDEIRTHLDFLADEHVRNGMSEREARAAARREFGGVDQVKENYHDQQGWPLLDALVQDGRYACRQLRQKPGFAALAIATLAIGIGGTTAMFSLVDAILLRPLGYRDPARLVALHERIPRFGVVPVNGGHFEAWRSKTRSFEQLAIVGGFMTNLTGSGDPQRLAAARVSPSLFPMLGVRALLGRTFTEDEDRPGRDRVVILSQDLWRSRFAADEGIVGREVTLNGRPYEVVGVLPADFHFPKLSLLYAMTISEDQPLLWKPMALSDNERQARSYDFASIARLKLGVSVSQASADLDVVQAQIAAAFPRTVASDLHGAVVPLQAQIIGRTRAAVQLLLAAMTAVLLIGCGNVANLLLARAAGRRREFALRRALGATRGRLARQALVESLVLAGVSGASGIAVAFGVMWLIPRVAPADVPRLDEVQLDERVLLFAVATSAALGLLVGLLPAWRSSKTSLLAAMQANSRASGAGIAGRRIRSVLVSLEVGLSSLCLVAAGLLVHSAVKLVGVDKGFDAARLVTLDLNLPGNRYPSPERRVAFLREALARTQSLPGVASVGMVSRLPLSGESGGSTLSVDGTNVPLLERPLGDYRVVNADYFRTLAIPLLAGRVFNDGDRGQAVAVVSASTAERLWPGQDPIGKRFRMGPENSALNEVVGVVGDVRGVSLSSGLSSTVYFPYWQNFFGQFSLVLKTATNLQGVLPALRGVIHDIDPELPVASLRTMRNVVVASVAPQLFETSLVTLFSALAMLLACLGIYSVVSHGVAQRTGEIGIRIALGAGQAAVLRMILGDALRLVGGGLAIGLPLGMAAAAWLRSLLFGVAPNDPVTIVTVSVLVTVAALVAAYVPARRASHVDPVTALRQD